MSTVSFCFVAKIKTKQCVFNFASGEPLKKKKKLDMSIIITREQRKMRKIEKLIRRQEAKGRQLKPIDEIEGDRSFLKTLEFVTTFQSC